MDSQSTSRKLDDKRHSAMGSSTPDLPEEPRGMTGGPATEAVPHGGDQLPRDLLKERQKSIVAPQPGQEEDGGEAVLSGRVRESGGERPGK